MIRVFQPNDKTFETNGDAVIIPIKARVKNQDNGDFILDLTCDIKYNSVIKDNYIIVADTPQGAQAFRVRTITKKANRLEVKAWHVFYDSENYVIADSYAVNKTCDGALTHFNLALDSSTPFMVYSNISKVNNLRIVRNSFNEAIEKVIERWGGHLYRDNFSISVNEEIGEDKGVTIEYKKNLKELTAVYDWGEVVTKILPVGKDGTLIDSLYIEAAKQWDIPFTKVVEFQQDIDEEDYPTQADYIAALKADLYTQAFKYVNEYCYPRVNYTLKGNPEIVSDIGDTIHARDRRLGIDLVTKVTGYEYDAYTKQYISIEFGNFQNNLKTALNNYLKAL